LAIFLLGAGLTQSSGQFIFQPALGLNHFPSPNIGSFHFLLSNPITCNEQEISLSRIATQLFVNADEFEFEIANYLTDQLHKSHYRLNVFHQGALLHGVQIILHMEQNQIYAINGKQYIEPIPRTPVVLSRNEAIGRAIQHVGASKYQWEDSNEESLYKLWQEDDSASYYPKAVLVIVPRDWERPSQDLIRAYKVDVYAQDPLSRQNVFIDAATGAYVNSEELIHVSDVTGKAQTRYSGLQALVTDSVSPTSFRLRESGRGKGIQTYNLKQLTSYAAAVDFLDSNNYWDNANSDQDEVATDAHWGAQKTYDYFWNKFARNSFDNKGTIIKSYVHYSKNYNNAFWNGSVMTYGDGNGTTFTPLTSIDVCGHEISHAVTTTTAGLVYSYESGALNESFSDIFGNAIEAYAKPLDFKWNIGEDITPSGTGLRMMQSPKSKGHPDTYKGKNWRTGAADNGGVHSNSGVQNFWFYLLSVGGKGTNDNSDAYVVDSIGILKAEQIAYRNLSVYLTNSSQYMDARYYAIQSAADLYGVCGPEYIATTNAWYAVGVGDKYDSAVVIADFRADTFYCSPTASVQFLNRSSNARSYLWSFGDGKTSTTASPIHDYTAHGQYDVTLIAEGCFQSKYDTMVKTAYIQIDSNFDICKALIMPRGSYDTIRACSGFVYDNGGDQNYYTLVRDTLTIDASPADSLVLEFSVFDYEDKFDSVYLYDGSSTSSPLIGGFTGQNLPNGGRITAFSGSITIRHFSDPFVTGEGFKASFTAHRPALSLVRSNDTLVCRGSILNLKAIGQGGYAPDNYYWWDNILDDTSFQVQVFSDTSFTIKFGDTCTKRYLYDTIRINVLDPLDLVLQTDTIFCYKEKGVQILANASGGLTTNHTFRWTHNGSTTNPLAFTPNQDTALTVILDDGCTLLKDTATINIKVRAPLKLLASKDTVLCAGNTTNMHVKASGGLKPYNFFWSHALGTDSSAINWKNVDTTYSIILSDACSGLNDTSEINVKYLKPLQLNMSSDTAICYGTPANLVASVKGGDSVNYNYTWSGGLSNFYRHQVNPTSISKYFVTVSDGCSQAYAYDSILLVVHPPLKVAILGKDTICHGERIPLEALATGGRITTYLFSWSDGLGTSSIANANPLIDTTYSVIISDGCTKNDTAYKRITVRPQLELTKRTDTTICSGDSVNLMAFGKGGLSNGYTYFWNNGVGYGAMNKVGPRFTTKYHITLNDGCSNFAEDSVLITVIPTPNISFYMDPIRQCVGNSVQFNNTTANVSLSKFLWQFGDGASSTSESTSHSYSKVGIYDVRLKITNEFKCSDELLKTAAIEIIEAPKASFTYTPKVATILSPLFNFTNTSTHANHFNWSFGDGFGDTILNPSHTYADTGYYWVDLNVSNDIGCTDFVSEYLRVKEEVLFHIPNAFTPNNDVNNETFRPYVRGMKTYELSVYNRWGELLFKTNDVLIGWNGKNPSGGYYPNGVYMYEINGLDIDRNKVYDTGTFMLLR
jgi:gliding motility-associated-like protein